MDKVLFFKVFNWLSFVGVISPFLTSYNQIKYFFPFLLEQMGKFYELFEMDAHVGAKELELQYMKVSVRTRVMDFL